MPGQVVKGGMVHTLRMRALLCLCLLAACSSRPSPPDLKTTDATFIPFDLAPWPDLGQPAPDLALPPDLAPACLTSFSCDARTAEHGCGVTTATGQRYPDAGAPYCPDKLSRAGCSCDLVRCTSPGPLCPGSYRAIFNEMMHAGCSGRPGQLDGTCNTLWNVVQSFPDGRVLADQTLYNVYLTFDFKDYELPFTLAAPAQVRLLVQQSCWFSDVSGSGNSGRAEVSQIRVAP